MARRKLLHLTAEERRTLAIPAVVAFAIFTIVLLGVITGLTHSIDLLLETNVYRVYDKTLLLIESPGQRRIVYPVAIVLGTIISYRRKDLLPVIVTVAALVFTNAVTGVFKLIVARGYPRTAGPEAFDYAAFKDDGSLFSYAKYVWQLVHFHQVMQLTLQPLRPLWCWPRIRRGLNIASGQYQSQSPLSSSAQSPFCVVGVAIRTG